jgi:RNA polymerase sigma-70 factor (ECF subfamily)
LIERTNDEWVGQIARPGPDGDEALADLRDVLRRGLGKALRGHPGADEAFREDVTQDALMKVLGRLDSFRGESKFTTWAIAVGVRVAFTELRRARWRDVSLDDLTASGSAPEPVEAGPDSSRRVERDEVIALMKRLIETELNDRQRFVALAGLNGLPQVEVRDRLGLNENAFYKLSHDLRQKLKRALVAAGIDENDVRELFDLAS